MSTNDNSLEFGNILDGIESVEQDLVQVEENFEQLVQNVVDGNSLPIPGEDINVDDLPKFEADGVEYVIVDGNAIPLSVFLGDVEEIEPQAPAALSGGGSAQPFVLGDIGPAPDLTDLLPPTALQFPVPEEEEVFPGLEDDNPDVDIIPDDPVSSDPALDPVEALVDEVALPEGTNPTSNDEVTTGDLVVDTGNDELASLVINGIDVTNGGTVQGEYGILTVFVDADGNYTWDYELTDNTIDHPDAGSTGTDEGVTDAFTVVVTDDDGDTATDSLVIGIVDDGPVAVNDAATVEEDQPVVIEVFSNDTEGADGVDITTITFDDTGTAGDVVYNGDGTFTFTPEPGFEGETTFTYTIVDGDGDPSTATVTISGPPDSEPVISVENGVVDEAGLTDASDPSEFETGSFDFDTGNDTVASLVVGGVDVTNGGTVTGTYGVLTVTLNQDGTYSYDYELTGATDDHNDPTSTDTPEGVADVFDVVLTDSDGDTASTTLTIDVLDDGPIATDDSASQANENDPITVDVFANDDPGADGVDIDAGVNVVPGSLSGTGTLVDNGDGTFTYTPGPGEEDPVTFEYTITDADGDTSTATVTIDLVADSEPTIQPVATEVDEGALDDSGTTPGSTAETTSGDFTIATGNDTVETLVIDGVDVTNGGMVTGTYGTLTVTLNADGSYSWEYDLADNTTDHTDTSSVDTAEGISDVFDVVVTDSDGDVANAALTVDVLDDGPIASLDVVNGASVIVDETVGDNAGEDESASLGSVTIAGSDLFADASQTGADDNGATTEYSLNITGTDTNLSAEGGLVVVLVDNNGVIEGHAGNAAGTLIFTIEIDDATGDVTVTQLAALDHPDAADPDDAVSLLDGFLEGVVTVTDSDGDQATDSADLGGVFTFEDDAPEIAVSLSGEDAVLDETNAGEAFINGPISTTTNGSVLNLDTAEYGSDGVGSLVYSILGMGASGLQTADGDLEITLEQTSDTVISGTYNGGADTAFTIEIDPATGELTVTQNVALEHTVDGDDSNGEHNDVLDLSGLVTAHVTITDGDGDQDTDSLDIGGNIQFFDDGPSIELTVNPAPVLVTDDDNIANPLTNNDSGSFADLFNIAFGADGAAAADSVDYDFAINGGDGTDSALNDAITGENILLRLNGDSIEGYLENSGDIAFTIEVATDGTVTQTQLRSIQHDDPTDSQETGADAESMAADLISLSLTVTDNDGDTTTQSVDVGNSFTFEDAGPIAGGLVLATVDEDGLANGVGDNAPGDIVSINTAQTLDYGFNVHFGEDGAGVDDLVVSLGAVTTNDPSIGDVVLTSGGEIVQTSWDPVTYTLTGFTSAGDVFTMVVNPDTDRAQFTLLAPLDHPSTDADGQNDGPDTSYEDDLRLTFEITATDGDGDTVDRTIWIRVDDDSPIAVDDGNIDVVEGDPAGISGNVLANDSEGADTATVTHIDLGAGFVAIDSGNDLGGGVYEHVTANGTYTIDAEGNWTFVASNGLAPGSVGTFEYRLTDGDGDAVEATQTITILDGAAPQVGGAIALQVDEDDLSDGSDTTPESLSDADSLTFTAGADDLTSIVFSNDLSTLTADGDTNTAAGDISWVRVDDTTIEGSVDGQVVVTLELNAPASITNGTSDAAEVTMTLSEEFDNLFGDNAETVLNLGYIGVVASEDDGDSVTGDVILSVVDDVPTAEIALNPEVTLLVDESLGENVGETEGGADGLGSVTVDGNFLFTDSSVLGADGGDVAYTLTVDGAVPTGLVDTATGENIVLSVNGDGTIITGSTEIGGVTAFTIEIDPNTGDVTLTQQRALDHGDDGNDHDSVLTLANDAIALVATATDGDGDTDSDSVNFGDRVQFEDDGPVITQTGNAADVLVTDDTDITDSDMGDFSNLFSAAFGADGAAATDSLTYALSFSGTTGLVDTLTGEDVVLSVNGDGTVITGSTELGGLTVFTLTLDPDTGEITQEQLRAVEHNDPLDPVESGASAAVLGSTITLTVTAEDGDGDTVSSGVDIGSSFTFEDDGPAITGTTNVSVDEEGLTGGNLGDSYLDGGDLAGNDITADGDLGVDFGEDGPGDAAFALSAADATWDAGSNTLNADDGSWNIVVAADGSYTFTLTGAQTHATAGTEDDLVIDVDFTVTDGDGDSQDGSFTVTVDDDAPVITQTGNAADVLVTDDTDITDSDMGDFSNLFSAAFGADGAAATDSLTYALSFSGTTGLVDTLTGEDVVLSVNGDGTVITGSTELGGLTVFTLTLDPDTGEITQSQERAVEHNDPLDPVESGASAAVLGSTITLTATAEDGDGDTVSSGVDIGSSFTFEDDGPAITGTTNVSVDEEGLAGGNLGDSYLDGGDLAGNDITADGDLGVDFGEDGPGDAAFALSAADATWDAGSNTLNADDGSWNIVVAADGSYTFTLTGAQTHATAGTEDDLVIDVDFTVTDGDGDSQDGSFTVTVDDDAPVITQTGNAADVLVTDDTDITDSDMGDFSNLFSAAFGADGAAATDSLTYALSFSGTTGLVDTLTGEDVVLSVNGDGTVITGSTELGGLTVFTLTLDPDTGEITQSQERAVEHNDPLDPVESGASAAVLGSTITLTATAEDGDGDTVSSGVDIGSSFTFEDDGPAITGTTNVSVDEEGLAGGNLGDSYLDGGDLAGNDITADGDLGVDFGEDGPGDAAFALSAADATWDAGSNTLNADDGSWNIVVAADGSYTFTLTGAQTHATAGTEDDLVIDVDFTVTDGDGDSQDGSFTVTVDDDAPVITQTGNAADVLVTDDTDITDSDMGDFSNLFSAAFGADGAAATDSLTYALSFSGTTGLVDTLTGEDVVLSVNGDGTVITGSTELGGLTVFTLTLDPDTGEITQEQLRAVEHNDPLDPVESGASAAVLGSTITLTATAEDGDGDTVSSGVDIGSSFTFEDDGPAITGTTNVSVDEEGLTGGNLGDSYLDGGDLAGNDITADGDLGVDFGEDGPGDAAFALSAADATWDAGSNTLNADDGSWNIVVAADGSYTFTLTGAQTHATAGTEDDLVIDVDFTVTDGDGDSQDGSFTVTVDDDAPVITQTGNAADVLVTDDTDITDSDMGDFSNLFSAAFGADGAAATDSLTYALSFSGTTGLVDTLTGEDVVLSVNGDGTVITGSTELGGLTVFTLTLDPDTGEITQSQERAVEHNDPLDPVESGASAAVLGSTITLTATAEDGDGDTVSSGVDIGSSFTFEDDGPAINSDSVAVDEDGLAAGIGDSAAGDDAGTASASGTLSIDFGADGGAADELTLALDSITTSDPDVGAVALTSGGVAVTTVWDAATNTFTGHTGDVNDPVFTLEVNNDGTYDFTLLGQLDHPSTDADGDNNGPETAYEDNLILTFTATATDGDGDTAQTTFTVNVDDDSPIDFTPATLTLTNSGTASDSAALDFFGSVGADQPGSIVFDSALNNSTLTAVNDDGDTVDVTFEGETITLTLNGDGTTLTATSDDTNTTVFTVQLNPDGSVEANDLYTVTMFEQLDDGAALPFDTGSAVRAGNSDWIELDGSIPTGSNPDPDLLITAYELPGVETVNTTGSDIGNGNQWINDDEIIRVDMVNNITSTPAQGNTSTYNYDSHFEESVLSFEVAQLGGNGTASMTIRILTTDDIDQDATPSPSSSGGDDVYLQIDANEVVVYDENGAELIQGVDYTFTGGTPEGGITLSGIEEGWRVEIVNDTPFEAVEIEGGTDQFFAVNNFLVGSAQSGTELDMSFGVVITDEDGDSVDSTVDITVQPVAQSSDALASTSTSKASAFESTAEFTADMDSGEFGDMSMTRGSSSNFMDMAAMMTMVAAFNELSAERFEYTEFESLPFETGEFMTAGTEAFASVADLNAEFAPLFAPHLMMGEPVKADAFEAMSTIDLKFEDIDGLNLIGAEDYAAIEATDALENIVDAAHAFDDLDLGSALQALPQHIEALTEAGIAPDMIANVGELMPGLVDQLDGADLASLNEDQLLEAFFDNEIDGLLAALPSASDARDGFTSAENGDINSGQEVETAFFSVEVGSGIESVTSVLSIDDGHMMMLANSITGA